MANVNPPTQSYWKASNGGARHLWNWILRRQGLSPNAGLESLTAIAHATLGLHSARLPSPFSTVLARGKSHTVAMNLLAPESCSELMTVRCMRKTLHALPPQLARIAHGATQHFRVRDALRAIASAEVSSNAISGVTERIIELLSQARTLSPRTIEGEIVGQKYSRTTIRLAVKLAWEQGLLTYINDSRGWNREIRRFGLTRTLHPSLDMFMEREAATCELIREYFDRYGPASVRDAAWWSGLSRSAVITGMRESGRDFVEVRTPWCSSPTYMYMDRFNEFQESCRSEFPRMVHLLAHEDVALKAYFESRPRYLGVLSQQKVFNTIGEVLPTIMVDGNIVGTWRWDQKAKRIRYSTILTGQSPEIRHSVRVQAHRATEAFRLGLAP